MQRGFLVGVNATEELVEALRAIRGRRAEVDVRVIAGAGGIDGFVDCRLGLDLLEAARHVTRRAAR